ncbi:MAG: site-specific integrase [Defluviitaleaceae bacterium]|nr:site-specific integrase [Defluviitaleaceae bacterium]
MKKRPDGRYQLSIMIGYNADGKPKRKLIYGKTQKEVKERANELRLQYSMGLEVDSDITVGEWAKTWLNTYKTNVEYNTHTMYGDTLRLYVIAPLGNLKLKDLKTAHLQKIVNDNSHKPRTVKIFALTVNQMLEQAVINDLILKNQALGIHLPPVTPKKEKRALTAEEFENIKALSLDIKTRCFVFLLLYTGMRRGEALAITKDDIDWSRMEISVNKSIIFKVNKSEIKYNPKTKAGLRAIPILAPLQSILREYVNSIDSQLLFVSQDGETMTKTGYRYMWSKFEKAIGTKDITAHIFRHNYATLLYNAGVDIKSAQVILGHSSIGITMDIYTHLDNRNKEATAEKLNDFLLQSLD